MQQQAARLREAGLRVTAPRLVILTALESDRRHPSAEELYASLHPEHPSLSLSTIYKTLEAFLLAGLCRRVNTEGSLRVDGTTREHDHAICRNCGRIFDIDRKHARLECLPGRLPHGLLVSAVRIEYDVVCATCRGGAAGS